VRVVRPAALKAIADAADALARLARAALEDEHAAAEDLVPLAEAARIAATSTRVLRHAIRVGELDAFGRQRDRSVRRADLARWIESRRTRPTTGPVDEDIARRVIQLSRQARTKRNG
jgi:hypothetical protein